MKYLIANWKANKNIDEARQWISEFGQLDSPENLIKNAIEAQKIKIIVCPPAHLLHPLIELEQMGLEFGVQDISEYDNGIYTGEITANGLRNLAIWSIIGHSERRRLRQETKGIIEKKIHQAEKYGIKTILCFSTPEEVQEADLLCFEPVSAISTGDGYGHNAGMEEIGKMKNAIPVSNNFIYGGSVNEQNISQFMTGNVIDGILSGGASLDAGRFFKMATLLLEETRHQ